MWCSGSQHPSLGNSWRQFNSVHPDQLRASLVQPGRRRGVAIAETRVRISDGAPNFSRRAVSLTEKPRASNAARCGFDSCTASQLPSRGRNSTGRVRVFQTRLSGFESRRPLLTFVDAVRPRSSDGQSASPVRKRSRVRLSPRALSHITRASPRG